MGSLLARVHFGRVSCGSASGLELFAPRGLAVATGNKALPSVGLIDGPECKG